MKIKAYEERYMADLSKMSEYDTVEFIKDTIGRIRVKPYVDRWRSPKETIKYYQRIIKIIEDNFVK